MPQEIEGNRGEMKTESKDDDGGLVEAVVTVKGEVQRVGYRDYVAKIARKLAVTGYAQNVKPYDVRIIASGKKKDVQEFLRAIEVQNPPINVESVETKFRKSGKKYKYFEIKRGNMTEELSERIDVAGSVMYEIRDLQKESLRKQDETINQLDSGNKMLGEKIESGNKLLGEKMDNVGGKLGSFHQDTAKRFDTLDVKYGAISGNIERLMEKMDKNAEQTEKTLELLAAQQKDFNTSVKGLTGAILKLAEKKT